MIFSALAISTASSAKFFIKFLVAGFVLQAPKGNLVIQFAPANVQIIIIFCHISHSIFSGILLFIPDFSHASWNALILGEIILLNSPNFNICIAELCCITPGSEIRALIAATPPITEFFPNIFCIISMWPIPLRNGITAVFCPTIGFIKFEEDSVS